MSCEDIKQEGDKAGANLVSDWYTVAPNQLDYTNVHCDMSADNKPSQSPIKAGNGQCLQPDTADCAPPQDTPISLAWSQDCSANRYMQFTYDSDGVLRHACSRMFVCFQTAGGFWEL